jgi:hypothetical protein
MPKLQSSSPYDAGDVEAFFHGDRIQVVAGPGLLSTGWRGGQFVRYVTGTQDFTVEKSDGNEACGFLFFQAEKYTLLSPGSFGSNGDPVVGSPENYLSHQFLSGIGGQNVATMINGGMQGYFKMFETISLNAFGVRAGPPITYSLNETLKVSENGLFCNDSDANLAAAGIVKPIVVGLVSAVPSNRNLFRLGVDLKY